MRRGIAVLAAIFGFVPPALSAAVSDTVVGDDLLCERSLDQAEKDMRSLYADLESGLVPLEGARLRRAQTDWLRFRESDCAFADAGTPGRKCCLLRQTEERSDTLRLYLAQLGPVDFRTWTDPVRKPEKQSLKARVTDRGPAYAVPVLPDQLLRVADSQYLLAFSSTRADARGLEYVNLRQRDELKVLEGGPTVLGVLADQSEARHVVVLCDTVDRRVLWRELHTVRLVEEAGRLVVRKRRLALFREDAGAGRCDRHSAEFLKMDKAVVPGKVQFVDRNGDGVKDISLPVAEVDCRTQEEEGYTLTFLAGDNGFGQEMRDAR